MHTSRHINIHIDIETQGGGGDEKSYKFKGEVVALN
jgi:hypothetical protein